MTPAEIDRLPLVELRRFAHHQRQLIEAFRRQNNDQLHRIRDLEGENERLRKALELACEDGWDDGQWAMRRYIEMAQAHLSGSKEGDRG